MKEIAHKYNLKIEERVFAKGLDIVPGIIAGEIDIAASALDAAVAGRAAGAPVSGLQITQSAGAAVLYDAGSSYSDAFGATQGRGMAVLVNATASSIFPGTPVTITYKAGATLGTVDVYAVRGALTIADVLVK